MSDLGITGLVVIRPDLRNFSRELTQGLTAALRDAERQIERELDFRRVGERLGDDLGRGLDRAEPFDQLSDDARDVATLIEREFAEVARSIERDMTRAGEDGFSELSDEAKVAARIIAEELGRAADQAQRRLSEAGDGLDDVSERARIAGEEIEDAFLRAGRRIDDELGDAGARGLEEIEDRARRAADEVGDQFIDAGDRIDRSLRDAGDDAFDAIGADARRAADEVGDQFRSAGDEIGDALRGAGDRAFDDLGDDARRAADEVADAFDRTGEQITADLSGAGEAAFDELGDDARRAADEVADAFNRTGEQITDDLRDIGGAGFRELADEADDAADRIERRFRDAASDTRRELQGAFDTPFGVAPGGTAAAGGGAGGVAAAAGAGALLGDDLGGAAFRREVERASEEVKDDLAAGGRSVLEDLRQAMRLDAANLAAVQALARSRVADMAGRPLADDLAAEVEGLGREIGREFAAESNGLGREIGREFESALGDVGRDIGNAAERQIENADIGGGRGAGGTGALAAGAAAAGGRGRFGLGSLAGFAGAFAGFQVLQEGFQQLVEATLAAAESQANVNRLRQLLATTQRDVESGRSIEELTRQFTDFASALQFRIAVDDDEVVRAVGVLTTFLSIPEELFQRATIAAADVQDIFGGDLPQSAEQLAKALEDPVRGLGQLRRIGITFNADQEESIRNAVEQNDLLSAQVAILEAIEAQSAGAAAASATTFDRLTLGLSVLQEEFGAGILAGLDEAADELGDAFTGLRPLVRELGVAFGGLAEPLAEGATQLVQALTEQLDADTLERLFGAIIEAVPSMVELVVELADNLPELIELASTLLDIVTLVGRILRFQLSDVGDLFPGLGDVVRGFGLIGDVVEVIGSVAGLLGDIFAGDFSDLGDGLLELGASLLNLLLGLIPDWLESLVGFIVREAPNIASGLAGAIGGFVTDVVPAVAGDVLDEVLDFFTDALPGFVTDIVSGIASFIGDVLREVLASLLDALATVLASINVPVLGRAFDAAASALEGFADSLRGTRGEAAGLNAELDALDGRNINVSVSSLGALSDPAIRDAFFDTRPIAGPPAPGEVSPGVASEPTVVENTGAEADNTSSTDANTTALQENTEAQRAAASAFAGAQASANANSGVEGARHGGIFERPAIRQIGEAGREVVIPLTDALRAADLTVRSGLLDLVAPLVDLTDYPSTIGFETPGTSVLTGGIGFNPGSASVTNLLQAAGIIGPGGLDAASVDIRDQVNTALAEAGPLRLPRLSVTLNTDDDADPFATATSPGLPGFGEDPFRPAPAGDALSAFLDRAGPLIRFQESGGGLRPPGDDLNAEATAMLAEQSPLEALVAAMASVVAAELRSELGPLMARLSSGPATTVKVTQLPGEDGEMLAKRVVARLTLRAQR